MTYWLPIATPGGANAAQFLANRYNNSIAKLNAKWKITASSFSDVKNHLHRSLDWAAVQIDNIPWIGVMQEQYLKVAVGAIKKYDPNHLILGMRGQNSGFWAYPEGILTFPELLKAMIPYVDVFDFHTYENLPEMEYMANISKAIGKPILLGEFSCTNPCLLYCNFYSNVHLNISYNKRDVRPLRFKVLKFFKFQLRKCVFLVLGLAWLNALNS